MVPGRHALLVAGTLAAIASAERLDNGLDITVTKPVDCKRKTHNGDVLSMHYNGTLADGTLFDSSHKRFQPFKFKVGAGKVIKGWDLGLLDMCIGEERTLVIPPELAYGSRGVGSIPSGATLTFETLLVAINGKELDSELAPSPSPPMPPPSTPSHVPESQDANTDDSTPADMADKAAADDPSDTTASKAQSGTDEGECQLLGPFALLVQGGLGLLALLSLVWKRWRERPRRPLKVWSFDVSKQVFGSALLHVLNLLMSILSSGDYELGSNAKAVQDNLDDSPNPCSLYLINIAVDTTLGIPILVLLLRVLQAGAMLTPLANPPESIKSGHYGTPPRASWWLKQSIVYFIGLVLMKMIVYLIFYILPWIALIGDWALRWTEGNEALQIAFVMFVFPLIMNALQYWIIDSFIKDRSHGDHEAIPTEDPDEHESREPLTRDDAEHDDADGTDDSTRPSEEGMKTVAAEVAETRATGLDVDGGSRDRLGLSESASKAKGVAK